MSKPQKARGALSNPANRYIPVRSVVQGDGWDKAVEEEFQQSLTLQLLPEQAKTIISRNQSPDVPFEQSINPYRGCEHGCIYCFARPSHAYMDLSPGLDFETRLFYKNNAAELLRKTLSQPKYQCRPIAIGTNTDPYQPIEKEQRVMADILQVLSDFNHPVSIVTKGVLIERDLDLLASMAERKLCSVMISMTSLDNCLKAKLEPRAASASVRLRIIAALKGRGIPVGVLLAPMIPMINDHELEDLLAASVKAGARSAAYILLRLPLEVRDLFYQWLEQHYPLKAKRVISVIRQSRGGRDYQSQFGLRQKGRGVFAELLAKRFAIACKKQGIESKRRAKVEGELNCSLFRVPPKSGEQMGLF